MTEPAHTPLYDWHVGHGGRMVPFGGWSMPVQYVSIVDEHHATRRAVGLFDISHMGRLRFDGDDAAAFLDSLVTRRVDNLAPGRIRYALVTNDAGGTLDDVLVYHLQGAHGPYHLLVVNASNRLKICSWIDAHIERSSTAKMKVQYEDLTEQTAMIAVQGPRALELATPLLDMAPTGMRYYTGREGDVAGTAGIVSRTGYTGEDGCELIVPAQQAAGLWDRLVTASRPLEGLPAGLGARDTLRLEAAMPLYGHELDETITAYQAGLDFAVDLEGRSFPGRDALARIRGDDALPRRIGILSDGRRVPREGYAIMYAGAAVGAVTSGTFSPTLEKPIAMGYVAPAAAGVGTPLTIDIRGRAEPAIVVQLPFYQRDR